MNNSERSYRKLGLYIEEYSHRNKSNEDIPVYSVTNSKGFCKEFFNKEVASQDKSSYKIVPRGCFAYNPSRVNVGSIAWQNEEDRVIVSPLYNIFKVSNELDNDYLLYYLKTNSTIAYIDAISRGTVRSNLRMSALNEFVIPYYAIDKQLSIVGELNAISESISLLQSQVSDLDVLTQAIFLDMFGDPLINPKHFDSIYLKDCSEFKNGINFSKNEDGNEYKFLGVSDFGDKYTIKECELSSIHLKDALDEEYYLKENDIVFVRSNGSKSMIGRSVMIQDIISPTTYSGFCIRCRLVKNTIIPIYLLYLLKTDAIVNHITSSGRGCNINNLNQKILGEIPVMIPDLPLQEIFARKISSIEEAKTSLNSQIAEMQTLLAARMQYWFD